ncbi:hypothetical protein PENTCL1PPCAC_3094 [Pristionchus entomophagus]|uniref:Uncharacterized protein n=1 Tax=Pristionchus entomophagus TaxID=358040 RepID=A0AAV5SLD5_9BILA|nr:hypothetical protein PENTCL1PPCAC_3094 [Pristionchus entomophagus]
MFCSFSYEEMKLALLISVLIASLCAVEIPVRVKGTLECSHPFDYRIQLLEQDNLSADRIASTEVLKAAGYKGKVAHFDISGTASESKWSILEKEVEPLMMIEHDCGVKDYTCICKDFGDVSSPLDETVNISLHMTKLKECKYCLDHSFARAKGAFRLHNDIALVKDKNQ